MTRNVLLASCLALALGTLGCQDQTNQPTAPTATSLQPVGKQSFSNLKQKRKIVLRSIKKGHLSDRHLLDLAARVIDPDDYICVINSPVIDWFNAEFDEALAENFPAMFRLIVEFAADQVPFVDALLVQGQADDANVSIGYDGEFTRVLLNTERDTKKFWDIQSADILLLAMKGTMLQDEARVAFVYQNFFVNDDGSPISAAQAAEIAATVKTLVNQVAALDGGNDPLFSFNAFAFTSPGIQDRIVMGDGILEGYATVGFADVAPKAVYAHEFAHHIQFENGYFDEIPPGGATTAAEFTRYTELMADAMAGYYLTHSRGAAMNKHRVAKFLSAFFQLGDCAFTNPGHHGTPNQRMRAAEFGFAVADQAHKQGHILTSDQFHDLFVAEYLRLIAPDAT
jgi:hypothetical protein